jgi:hypothetical protein
VGESESVPDQDILASFSMAIKEEVEGSIPFMKLERYKIRPSENTSLTTSITHDHNTTISSVPNMLNINQSHHIFPCFLVH